MRPLDRLARGLVAPPPWRHVANGIARSLPHEIALREDAVACDVLLALERIAPQPLGGLAALERDRLEAAGIAPRRGDEDWQALAWRLRAATLDPAAEALLDRALPLDPAAFAAALERDDDTEPEMLEHGPAVVASLLAFKASDGDGRPDAWTLGELRELMLDWLPRHLAPEGEAVAVAGEAIAAYLHLLDAHGRLEAPVPLVSLEAAVARLRPRLEQECRPPGPVVARLSGH